MSDRTNIDMDVISDRPQVRAAARELFESYSGGTYEDGEEGNTLRMGANEAPCGSTQGLAAELLTLIEQEGHEFAFRVHEDPAYDWLGEVYYHVPGLAKDFSADADADGNVVLTQGEIERLIETGTGLDLAATLERETGKAHREAFGSYDPSEAGS